MDAKEFGLGEGILVQVGLISGETRSQIQQQDLATHYDPFINQLLNNPPMFQGLAISNENQSSSQAEERARIDIRKANTQIMASERSMLPPLQYDCINNSHEARNSRWASPNLILNTGNQSSTPMVSSAGSSNVIIPMQNLRQNLQIGRTNAPARRGPNTGLALQLPNNAPENQGVQNQNNNNPENHVEIRSNSLYDPVFETLGLAPDPHIRLFEAQNGQAERGHKKPRILELETSPTPHLQAHAYMGSSTSFLQQLTFLQHHTSAYHTYSSAVLRLEKTGINITLQKTFRWWCPLLLHVTRRGNLSLTLPILNTLSKLQGERWLVVWLVNMWRIWYWHKQCVFVGSVSFDSKDMHDVLATSPFIHGQVTHLALFVHMLQALAHGLNF
ncbi:hypothetical protein JHK87_035627 [Glycine soja]|nr:hypothetical protein JHK87_035627 [Glycine soja]